MIKREYVYKGLSYRHLSISEQRKCSKLPYPAVCNYIIHNCLTPGYREFPAKIVLLVTNCIYNESRPYICPADTTSYFETNYKFFKTLIEERRTRTLEDSMIAAILRVFPGANPLELENLSMRELAALMLVAQSATPEGKDLLDFSQIQHGYNMHFLGKLEWCKYFAKMKRRIQFGMDPTDDENDPWPDPEKI